MSKVLMIRHLPTALSFQEKEKLLKHFGAEKVWETSRKRNYVFASFSTVDKAKASLARLHQLEIANRRLVVEYSVEKEPTTQPDSDQSSAITKHIQLFLKALNAWNPSVDFYQPPPVHLKYTYPDINPNIVINIIHALFTHKPLYVQILHLMNKMCLDTPFSENNKAIQFFKDTFRQFFIDEIHIPQPDSESESEISCEETERVVQKIPKFQRKRKLAVPIKTAVAVLSTASLPKVKKVQKEHKESQDEVFETVTPIQEPKKISVVVHQDALQKHPEEAKVVGELGKFHAEVQPEPIEETPSEQEQPVITKKELLKNRISYSDMKILPVFKNYHAGQPSMRLYIKNLHKSVIEQDVKRIYRRYIKDLTDNEQIGFDVRVMQEGRMKGQAFVTFPSVAMAEKALHETNGYLLKDKPMVVQFARAANKKTID